MGFNVVDLDNKQGSQAVMNLSTIVRHMDGDDLTRFIDTMVNLKIMSVAEVRKYILALPAEGGPHE